MREMSVKLSKAVHTDQRGVSIIEVVVAIAILSTVLVSLGGLMFQVASQTRRSAMVTHRSAAVLSSGAWVHSMRWDSIPNAVGCVTDTTGSFTYNRCLSYTISPSQLRRVQVVIAPIGAYTTRPETLVVERARPRSASTLNVR